MRERYREISGKMADPEVSRNPAIYMKLARDQSELSIIVSLYENYLRIIDQQKDLQELRQDPDFLDLVPQEEKKLSLELQDVESRLLDSILPRDERDSRNLFLEIRAGAGGEEAALFARELARMYLRFIERKGFRFEVMETNDTEIGGARETIIYVQGHGAFSQLKFESGVHRVQRVPVTEAGGRIHTSTVTVAMIPEASEVDVQIDPKDLRIDTFCASSAGGKASTRPIRLSGSHIYRQILWFPVRTNDPS